MFGLRNNKYIFKLHAPIWRPGDDSFSQKLTTTAADNKCFDILIPIVGTIKVKNQPIFENVVNCKF